MTSFVKELTLMLGLLTGDQAPVSDLYGWKDFVWRVRPMDICQAQDGMCVVIRDRWDWKREQYYSIEVEMLKSSNSLNVRLGLDNRDPSDRDNVCVVAIFTDADDKELAIFYQNWVSFPGKSYKRDTPLQLAAPRSVTSIAKIAIGTKQCDQKNAVDSQLFYAIRTMLDQR